jgi:hypothetical protein
MACKGAGNQIVECDQTALWSIGRKYSRRDSVPKRGDHGTGDESI